MNIVIAGSRDFKDYEFLKQKCDKIIAALSPTTPINIVCGMARGADLLGKRYAEEKGYGVIEMPADWDKYGKSAGYRRNEDMARIGSVLIAFRMNQSRGTGHMIDLAEKHMDVIYVYEV